MTDRNLNEESPLTASVQRLRQELDRWMEAAMSSGNKALSALGIGGDRTWHPPVDLIESPENIRVLVNVPGADPSRIDVSLAGNMLTISGEVPPPVQADHDILHVQQRPAGRFERSVPMPVPVNPDEVRAEARHGVLTILIAKAERAKARQIPIRSSEAASAGEKSSTKPKKTSAENGQ